MTLRSLDDESAVVRLGGRLVDGELDGAAHHHRGELGVRGRRRRLAHDLAEPDDGDAVGDLADLAELVGDEDDGCPGRLELAHDLHQLVGLLRREHGGRLVEDEHLRVARERLDDLDALLHADGQILDERVGVDVEAEALRDLAHALARRVQIEQSAARVDSWPSMTFSATVKTGISMKCWCTMPMPARIASPGPWKFWT